MRHHWQLPPPKSWWPSIPDHPPFVGNQTVQDLLPDTLLVLGNGASLAPFLNGRKPVLEGVHIAWRPAFAFQSCHFVLSQVSRFISLYRSHYSKVMAQ